MTESELQVLQNLPLEVKIMKTKQRIKEWVNYYGKDHCYISFSGGKDSTVLLNIVRQVYPDIEAVFIDTGLEYPEIKNFVKTIDNVRILRPKMNFKQVIENYGYPMISKEQSQYLYDIRTGTEKMKLRRLYGSEKGRFKLAKKYRFLIDAPFNISHKCCQVMKKDPAKKYEKEMDKVPFLGTMAEESELRLTDYLKTGCNAFENNRPKSTPLGFWTEQDVLKYIKINNIKIADVYGDIIENELGNLETTGCKRTGCVFCGFGVHLENYPNRYQQLEKTHPKLWTYCMEKLNFKQVCEYMSIPYKNPKPDFEKQKEILDESKLF